MKIKKNDTVKILSGKERGKTGKVLKVFPEVNKILVEGLNFFKKHRKPKKGGEKGQLIEFSRPMNASNAILVCPKCGTSARIGYQINEKSKSRICKKCDQEI